MLPSGRSSLSSGGDLHSIRGETFAPFGGRPLIPSGETLAALEKTLNHIRETLAPLRGELCSPRGDICSLRGRPLLPSGGGLCSPNCSVEAGMVSHSCRVIRLRALPGCDLEPGWASKCSEPEKCGACAAEWGAPHIPGPEYLWGTGGQTPFLPMDPEGGRAILRHRDSEPPQREILRMAGPRVRWPNPVGTSHLDSLWLPSGDSVSDSFLVPFGVGFGTHFGADSGFILELIWSA